MKLEDIGMQASEILNRVRETRSKIREFFGDKVDTIVAYDIVDAPNHQLFKLKFVAYDYFGVQFNYDNDLCGFSIVLNEQFGISLEDEIRSYNGTKDWEGYLKGIMTKLELRIPDKFLASKGWL